MASSQRSKILQVVELILYRKHYKERIDNQIELKKFKATPKETLSVYHSIIDNSASCVYISTLTQVIPQNVDVVEALLREAKDKRSRRKSNE